jgi:hypothetical protein
MVVAVDVMAESRKAGEMVLRENVADGLQGDTQNFDGDGDEKAPAQAQQDLFITSQIAKPPGYGPGIHAKRNAELDRFDPAVDSADENWIGEEQRAKDACEKHQRPAQVRQHGVATMQLREKLPPASDIEDSSGRRPCSPDFKHFSRCLHDTLFL